MTKGLEALMEFEKHALDNPKAGAVTVSDAAIELLPHIKHSPYFSLLISRAQAIVAERDLKTNLTNILAGNREELESKVRSTNGILRRVRRVRITNEDMDMYMLGLAERIVSYAQENLPQALQPKMKPMELLLLPHLTGTPARLVSAYVQLAKTYFEQNKDKVQR